jgi:hypothetical protein
MNDKASWGAFAVNVFVRTPVTAKGPVVPLTRVPEVVPQIFTGDLAVRLRESKRVTMALQMGMATLIKALAGLLTLF